MDAVLEGIGQQKVELRDVVKGGNRCLMLADFAHLQGIHVHNLNGAVHAAQKQDCGVIVPTTS